MLRKLVLSLTMASGLVFATQGQAEAAIADGLIAAPTQMTHTAVIQNVQYVYGGQNYCWYAGGWKGPGWYWCGYAWRAGYGWGGGYGWRGWRYGGYRPGFYGGAGVARYGYRYGGARVGYGGARVGYGGARVGYGGARVAHYGGGGVRRRSDARVKHDIVLLGRLNDGLGFYRFVYNGGHTTYVGVIAQEVQAIAPDAVTRDAEGYLRVSYDQIGLPFETYKQWVVNGARLPTPKPAVY